VKVLDVRRRDEDEVAWDVVDTDGGPARLRVPTRDREPLLLHRGEDVPLQEAQVRELVQE
jgi:hypothetical protein